MLEEGSVLSIPLPAATAQPWGLHPGLTVAAVHRAGFSKTVPWQPAVLIPHCLQMKPARDGQERPRFKQKGLESWAPCSSCSSCLPSREFTSCEIQTPQTGGAVLLGTSSFKNKMAEEELKSLVKFSVCATCRL